MEETFEAKLLATGARQTVQGIHSPQASLGITQLHPLKV